MKNTDLEERESVTSVAQKDLDRLHSFDGLHEKKEAEKEDILGDREEEEGCPQSAPIHRPLGDG